MTRKPPPLNTPIRLTKRNAHKLLALGQHVRLDLLPYADSPYYLEVDSTGDPGLDCARTMLASLRGHVTGVVSEEWSDDTGDGCAVTAHGDGERGYPDGVVMQWYYGEISTVTVLKHASPPRSASVEKHELEMEPLGSVRVNGDQVSPALIAAVAHMRGRTYPGCKISEGDMARAVDRADYTPAMSFSGFRCGCVDLSLAGLDQALDILASWYGWNDA